ncbi:MAG: hypothetical protein IJI50_06050 [Ruminococcus sp.]|nr:hypothetical protein [Ruminococcus sp.]
MDDMRFSSRAARGLLLIYALNVADWICTVVLLRGGGFFEANPLMRGIVGDISAGFAVKCLLPLLLILVLARLFSTLNEPELHGTERVVKAVFGFYLFLCVNHIANFVILFLRQGS